MATYVGSPSSFVPSRYEVVGERRYRLSVLGLGLACCGVELDAASTGWRPLDPADSATSDDDLRDVLVVSGTLTDVLVPLVRRAYDRLREPYVVSFGVCTATGGPYWDSYAVTKGLDQLVPVDAYVPGCPPRPAALVAALDRLGDR